MDAVPVSGIVLTKMDGTARGGVILSVNEELKLPIKFIGTGERADDFDVFQPREFADALFAES
jgi:fused signal recognition particle receptor